MHPLHNIHNMYQDNRLSATASERLTIVDYDVRMYVCVRAAGTIKPIKSRCIFRARTRNLDVSPTLGQFHRMCTSIVRDVAMARWISLDDL